MTTSTADLGLEDGTDPKRFHDRRTWGRTRSPGRKALQLCRQVADALRVIFPDLADEVLQNLSVLSVEPAPHSGRLLVTVAAPATADVTDHRTAIEHLNRAIGRIRSEVASAVHRRKAPKLTFAVL